MFDSLRYSGISIYSCKDLKSKKLIGIYDSIKEKHIKNLKYLPNDVEINFHHNDYENIIKCLLSLDKNYKNINIDVYDKEKFNKIIKSVNTNKLDLKKIYICQGIFKTTLEDYIYYENTLYSMIKPAINLSPLEKYVYVYNIVKQYKKYKESPSNRFNSRELYKILFNNYIVCAGFSALLHDLLNKLNINSKCIHIMVDSEKIGKEYSVNHQRVYVNLEDKKYKINGYYLSDPTWDNYLEYDLYTYMLFTNSKNEKSKKFQYDDKSIIFNVKDINEFYEKFEELKTRFNLNDKEIIEYILSVLKELDPTIYEEINKINKKFSSIKIKEMLAGHIVKKVNNEINEKKIWKAIRAIYTKSYGFKNVCDMNNYLKEVKEYNSDRLKNSFYNNNKQKVLKKINYENVRLF